MILTYSAFSFMRTSCIVAIHQLSRAIAVCDSPYGDCCEFTSAGIRLCNEHTAAVNRI